MSSNTATYYPIDPELPRRDHSVAGQHAAIEDNNFANLIQAANSSTSQAHLQQRTESTKRKRSPSICSEASSLKRSKSLKYPYEVSRSVSPFRATSSPNDEQTQRALADPSSALFRSKSLRIPAKKYTRPPTKDVFQSLRIGTEEWVRLEAEAKAFMLDETHPERQASVGNRGLAPTNDTKIQLFKTVQNFLADGAGLAYFGSGTAEGDGEGESRWLYPRDEDRLIGLLTPLMRRMVTNERQRQYARRTRQSGVGGKSAEPEGLGIVHEVGCSSLQFLGLRLKISSLLSLTLILSLFSSTCLLRFSLSFVGHLATSHPFISQPVCRNAGYSPNICTARYPYRASRPWVSSNLD
jgi:hypothetical protein